LFGHSIEQVVIDIVVLELPAHGRSGFGFTALRTSTAVAVENGGDFSLLAPVGAEPRLGRVLPVLASKSMRGWLWLSTAPAASQQLRDGEP
jgi:hypothetical protein